MKARLDSCQEEAPLIRSSSLSKQYGTEGEILRCTRKCNVPEKYVKLMQDIVLTLRNQGVRVAGGKSSIFNVDVGLHQRSALNQYLFLILMDVMTDGVSK